MCDSNTCDQICKKQIAYEKAIDAYQFHVQRYHTWVNYYAIFVGALFVAFYTILSGITNEVESCCAVQKVDITDNHESTFFLFLISCLGLWTTICWLASTVGHYSWMKSWIEIVKKLEHDFLGTDNPVYAILIKNNVIITATRHPRFISTQKVTQIFLIGVIIAWNIIIIHYVMKAGWECWTTFISGTFSLIAILLIYYGQSKFYSSTLNIES